MSKAAKVIGVFTNLCTYGAGIAVLLIKLLKKDFIAVFILSGLNYNESLFFNLLLFCGGAALVSVVLTMLMNEYKPELVTVEFPVIWALLPAALGIVFLYFGFTGETPREKLIVIAAAAVYLVASFVNIYCGAKMFALFPKKK